ncbi:MAG: glycerophosphodiester phosphodiesterase family protein, partial [Sandaracinobacteroides sp.]
GPMVIQVNVARSSDGVLMLLHDPNLDRTTTGQGPLSARTYRQLREFQLKGPEGKILDERIPTLEEALVLARRRGAVLQLNPAPVILLAELLELLRGLRMERQVILQTGSLAQTREALKAAPEIMLSAASRSPAELAALGKLANPQLVAFIGQREPDPALVARLDQVGIELAVASSAEPGGNVSGKPGERQDDSPKADGKASRYADLASRGAALIATDEPLVAWRALKAADRDGTVCLAGQAR